jgi:two-component system CheB/CheR fusion protein
MQYTDELLIVALGASAGGLEALERFFKHMPADSGMAFIVVQHLAPDHPTALPEILARSTKMPVAQVPDNTKATPNTVSIISPNSTLTIKDGTLRVSDPVQARGLRTPIDALFTSLAEDCGENAVCIMLSGTGTDGTLGLRAIKEHGGMAMAQSLETAKYDAILRSAIGTGLVDHVLPVEEMPAKLMEYAVHLASLKGKPKHIREQIDGQLGKIYGLIRRRAGHDFSQYKESTIVRRMERRMKAAQIEAVEQYVELLECKPEEVDLLLKDLLIGVTQFFRDPEAFELLGREVVPKLFEGTAERESVRACIVGCASGEEAYSVGILLSEHASTLSAPPAIQIFATDIDERGLEMARTGCYPQSIADHVSPERLERFFTKEDGAYRVRRELRQLCVFSSHSFIKDPPFSRLNLISCRNVMIYLGTDLQKKVFPLFHYALRSGGYLFIGPSESATSHPELFRTVDKKHRIFQRKDVVPRPQVKFPLADISRPRHSAGQQTETKEPNLPKQLERIILQRFRPLCVTVRENGDAVHFSGGFGSYLEQPPGSPESNVINMARDGLRIPLRTSLHRAATTHERVIQKQISVPTNEGVIHVDLIVEPLKELQDANLYMIVFEEVASGNDQGSASPTLNSADETVRHLEGELQAAREQAQSAYEELETSNEELQSANEEYQSTNEELETSKEELQSFNEELETVNSELNRKVTELDEANSDLQNLLNSTQVATIFLNTNSRIRSFTPAAGSVFRLIASDIGRPITDLAAQFTEGGLVEDIQAVLGTLAAKERNLTGTQGAHFLLRILPYRTVRNIIDGVVLTFTDVTQLKRVEQQAQDAKLYAENIVATVREPLLVLDDSLRVQSANEAFFTMFQVGASDTVGQLFFDLSSGKWDQPALRHLLTRVLPERKTMEDFEVAQTFPNIGYRSICLNARRIDHVDLILLAMEDITDRKQRGDLLKRLNEDLRHFSYAASHDLQEPLRMVMSYTQLLARQYKGKLDPQADQFIAFAVEGAERMESLLRDLREYWSVNDQQTADPKPVDCGQALTKALLFLDLRIRESGGLVSHDPLPTVMAEETPLVLLFQNLIGNALKYRRPGEPPHVHVTAEQGASVWSFSVRDNGIGIEAKHTEQIFAPFKRLHGAEYAGSGIGLAICQRVVERYGGRIWVESEYGQGSTFRFTIPSEPRR